MGVSETDRDSEYTERFQRLMADYGVIRSMSRSGQHQDFARRASVVGDEVEVHYATVLRPKITDAKRGHRL